MQRRGGQRHGPLGENFYISWFCDDVMIWYKNLLSLVTDHVTLYTPRPLHMAAHIPWPQRVTIHHLPHMALVIYNSLCFLLQQWINGIMSEALRWYGHQWTLLICYNFFKSSCVFYIQLNLTCNFILLIKKRFGLILLPHDPVFSGAK